MHKVLIGLLAVSAAGAAMAQESIISNTAEASWAFNGELRVRPVEAASIPGGQALRAPIRRKGANEWEIQAVAPIAQGVETGDRITFGFYARAETPDPGKETARLGVRIQQSAAPWGGVMDGAVEVGRDWTFHCVTGPAQSAAAVGGIQGIVQLAGERHVIDLGPFLITKAPASATAPSGLPCGQPPTPPAAG